MTALSAYEGNAVLAGLTGILGAFLAIQVLGLMPPPLHPMYVHRPLLASPGQNLLVALMCGMQAHAAVAIEG